MSASAHIYLVMDAGSPVAAFTVQHEMKAYLKRRLAQWGEGYHAVGAYPMPRVARNLSPNEIDALASYLSFIR